MTLVKSPSLFFSCCLAHPLSSNIGQVVVFIIRFMISPHYKNNLKPLRSQSSKRLRMTVSFSTLLPIGLVRPFTSSKRVKRKPVDGMSQRLVTGKAKHYHVALATRLGYGNSARLGLKVSKGLPTIVGIAQLSPKLDDGGSAFSSRQGLYQLSCRHRGEKTFDFLTVAFHLWDQGLKLNPKRQQEFSFRSNNVPGNRQLSLTELLPKLVSTHLTEAMMAIGKSIPAPSVKLRESLRGGIRFDKISRDLALQIAENLQRPRVVLFEGDPDLMVKPRFLTHQSLVIPTEHLKFLCLYRIWLQNSQMPMIGPQKLRQYIGIKGVAFRLAHAKSIPGPIQRFGIDRIDHHSMIQKKIYNPPVRLLDRRPQLYLFSFSLMEPSTEFAHGFGLLKHLHLGYFLALWVADPNLVEFFSPIHSQIVSLHFLVLLLHHLLPIPSAVNGMFALYRSSNGQLSIEPLSPFSRWSGQSVLDPHERLGFDGPQSSKLMKSVLQRRCFYQNCLTNLI